MGSNNRPFDLNASGVEPPVKGGTIPEVKTTIEVSIEPRRVINLRDLHPDKFLVSQSDMKYFLFKGDERENYCPRYAMEAVIGRHYKKPPTDSMLAGSYFETLVLGSGAKGEITLDLPRKKISPKAEREWLAEGKNLKDLKGEKTIDQLRIEIQAERCKQRAYQLGVDINPIVTQVPLIKHLWDNIFLIGELDIFPALVSTERGKILAIIDLKLTSNVHSRWGDFCWGAPEFMDHTQAYQYLELVRDIDITLNPHIAPILEKFPYLIQQGSDGDIGFNYWVFGYQKEPLEEQENLNIWVEYDALKQRELYESVRKYIAIVQSFGQYGTLNKVPARPSSDNCKNCPVAYCTDRQTMQIL